MRGDLDVDGDAFDGGEGHVAGGAAVGPVAGGAGGAVGGGEGEDFVDVGVIVVVVPDRGTRVGLGAVGGEVAGRGSGGVGP